MNNADNQNKEVNETTNTQVVNTEVAGSKATEVVNKVKDGVHSFSEKVKEDTTFRNQVLLIGIIVILVIACGVCYLGGGAKSAVKGYAHAYVKTNAKKVVKYMHKDYLEAYEDYLDEDYEDYLDDEFEDWDDNDYKILSYEIVDEEKLKKDKVEDVADNLNDYYGIDEDDVKAAVIYTIKYKIDDDGDKDTTKTDVTVAKIKGKWYVFPGDLS